MVRQSWSFFQNDFAGRISNRVMQTGPAVRESLVSSITAVWYVMVYGITALIMMAAADLWLAVPILVWFAGYIGAAWSISCRRCATARRSPRKRARC